MGLDPKDAKNISESIYGAASIAATILGARTGKAITNATAQSSSKAIQLAGKVGGTATNFAIQASPDIVPLMWQAYKDSKNNNSENKNELAMMGQIAFNAATMIPLV